MEVSVAVEGFFPDEVCRVTSQNHFILAFVRYGNEESEWTAVSCDAAVETYFRSAIGARRSAIRYIGGGSMGAMGAFAPNL